MPTGPIAKGSFVAFGPAAARTMTTMFPRVFQGTVHPYRYPGLLAGSPECAAGELQVEEAVEVGGQGS